MLFEIANKHPGVIWMNYFTWHMTHKPNNLHYHSIADAYNCLVKSEYSINDFAKHTPKLPCKKCEKLNIEIPWGWVENEEGEPELCGDCEDAPAVRDDRCQACYDHWVVAYAERMKLCKSCAVNSATHPDRQCDPCHEGLCVHCRKRQGTCDYQLCEPCYAESIYPYYESGQSLSAELQRNGML